MCLQNTVSRLWPGVLEMQDTLEPCRYRKTRAVNTWMFINWVEVIYIESDSILRWNPPHKLNSTRENDIFRSCVYVVGVVVTSHETSVPENTPECELWIHWTSLFYARVYVLSYQLGRPVTPDCARREWGPARGREASTRISSLHHKSNREHVSLDQVFGFWRNHN